MTTLRWTSPHTAAPGTRVTVMASRFRIRRYRDVPRFLVDSLRIRRQVRAASGTLGVSLQAGLFRRQFLTLSAWTDRGAIRDVVRAEPHAAAMRRHRAAMTESTFVFYEVAGTELPPSWADARARLERQATSKSGRGDGAPAERPAGRAPAPDQVASHRS